MKYKVGDKVKVKDGLWYGELYGRRRFWNTGNYCGKTATIKRIVDYGNAYDLSFMDGSEDIKTFWTDEMLEPVEKTLDNLEVGDILVDSSLPRDTYRKVLGVLDSITFLSKSGFAPDSKQFNEVEDMATVDELKKRKYSIYQPVEVIELTLDQVAEKFGVDVTKLKIKK